MKVLLSAFGSRGDVQPLMLAAVALREAGHHPRLCVADNYLAVASALGLDAVSGGMDLDAYRITRGAAQATREMVRFVRDAIDAQRRVVAPLVRESDAYICGLGDFLGPSLAEAADRPFARLAYAPPFPSGSASVLFPTRIDRPWVNRALWRAQFTAINTLTRGLVNDARARLGLPRVRDILVHAQQRGETLLGYDDALAPTPDEWSGRFSFARVGYCTPPDDLDPMPEALEAFVAASGPPIVYVGFGSMNTRDGAAQAQTIVSAAARAHCRVVVGRGRADLELPTSSRVRDHAIFVDDVSHSRLFPSLAAVVHHGGAGTTHTAARSGVPQGVVAHLADQKFWGTMLNRRGAGPPPQAIGSLDLPRLTALLRALTTNARYRNAARTLASQMRPDSAPRRIVERLEALVAG